MLVEDDGPDVMGKNSDVIAPHGCCAGYEANYEKLNYTREGSGKHGKHTTTDVT